ncbi:MAG: glucosaminidase domain-containing protein [Chitinophagaceae bacterium]|jgi:flagellum-specific peptidoglycan hydrolase FlgJ
MVKDIFQVKSKWVLLTFFLFFFVTQLRAQSIGKMYVDKHKKKAFILMKQTGIPASIILGVSMIESGMGRSRNCKLLNNYFGIKGKNNLHKGKTGTRSAYKQYPDAMASFKDFARMVQTKKYYPSLKGNMDYKTWLLRMNASGYAEAKGKWIHDIETVIKKYNLTELDETAMLFDDENFPVWGTDTTILQLQNQED